MLSKTRRTSGIRALCASARVEAGAPLLDEREVEPGSIGYGLEVIAYTLRVVAVLGLPSRDHHPFWELRCVF